MMAGIAPAIIVFCVGLLLLRQLNIRKPYRRTAGVIRLYNAIFLAADAATEKYGNINAAIIKESYTTVRLFNCRINNNNKKPKACHPERSEGSFLSYMRK